MTLEQVAKLLARSSFEARFANQPKTLSSNDRIFHLDSLWEFKRQNGRVFVSVVDISLVLVVILAVSVAI